MCWFQGVYGLTKVLLRNYPKIGHVRVELIARMSWRRRRLCEHSSLPSRHHPNEESWKDSRLIKTKYKEWFKLINTQSAQVVLRGTKWSHGMVSIVDYALCTNPWSTWKFCVGLGIFPWSCIKRNISYNPWRGWHQVVIVIKIAVCKFKWSITKRSSAWSFPSIVVTMDLWRCAEEWLTHSGVWGSNHLVSIDPTQSRKVVQLDGVNIVII